MIIPRVSGLSMTTRSSSGVSPSAGPVRTTPKTMGKKAVPRRSPPSSAPPALRRTPSRRPSSLSASAAIDREHRVDGVRDQNTPLLPKRANNGVLIQQVAEPFVDVVGSQPYEAIVMEPHEKEGEDEDDDESEGIHTALSIGLTREEDLRVLAP
ncbi:hypothetical protein B296_00009668 [Ensete ventricosum]|uniref:Uncharacterized protein n=1 Tax=Ensete ventricosum TaxID=4639 RepID=A0A426ZIT8_ENSVE|nr:hypothetical protein B296_00009668 [Ensete ventricosum]